MKLKAISLIAIALILSACMPDYSSGFRIGIVQKASYKGIVKKSFEGEIVLEGIKMWQSPDGSGSMTNVFKFSAHDKAVISALENAANDGRRVKIYYNQWLFKPPLSQDTNYTVTRVEETQ